MHTDIFREYLNVQFKADSDKIKMIKSSLEEKGVWAEAEEWRISTVMEKKMEKIIVDNKTWYKVTVKNDHELSCKCPTVERAIEFLYVYDCLIMDMFYTLGWPSWAKKGQLKP